ncbi:MAG: GNAT family N-acetyltransferase [Burkholderiales bacterium]|nr:GNAT family N-acetyltransferase [Burkholderiales bacterium]
MLVEQAVGRPTSSKPLAVSFARNIQEVREAQRLRYKVFAEEMGSRVPGREQGIDCDIFDAYCEHLLVRDTGTGEVVGTYRILDGAQARRTGGFYSDGEFDLTRIDHLRDATVELGRSCVHPDYRNGTTIALLWSGIGDYLRRYRYQYLMGCASVSMADGGSYAASVYEKLRQSCLSPIEYRVFPRRELPLETLSSIPGVPLPPLIKGYVRAGSYVCGAPAWDADFNTADLLLLLPVSRMSARYARHFIGT